MNPDANPHPVLLVTAKLPIPGYAKTRLAASVGNKVAARLAAAALLDTLEAGLSYPGAKVVAWTGRLDQAVEAEQIRAAVAGWQVIAQRGPEFAHRLAAAHGEASARNGGQAVLQIGMDTPQITGDLLSKAGHSLMADCWDAVLGRADDGGWWALGVRDPRLAQVLSRVPMSRPDTGDLTHLELQQAGARVGALPTLRDVDTLDDAVAVADAAPRTRFASALAQEMP